MKLDRENRLREIHIIICIHNCIGHCVCKVTSVNISAADDDILRNCPASVTYIVENKEMLEFLKTALSGKAAEVVVSKKLKSHPVCLGVTGPVTIEMEKYFAQMPGDEAMKPKAQRVLELNAAHPVFEKFQKLYGEDKERAGKLAEVLLCQATLIAGLPIDDPAGYTEIICELV